MASFSNSSRYRNSSTGTFRDSQVIYPRFIDYNTLRSVASIIIEARSAFRPDLVSQAAYSRFDLGWHIMAFNKIDSPAQLTAGTILYIPDISGII